MNLRRSLLIMLFICSSSVAPAFSAAGGTDCPFGGPTPGWDAIRLDLPEGSDFLVLELGGIRSNRGIHDDGNWHLAEGVVVVNAATEQIEAYRIATHGTAPRRAVVESNGVSQRAAAQAPDVPFSHGASRQRENLPPGSYYVFAFGTDGGSSFPNEWWSAGIQVSGAHSCASVGDGEVFDVDQTDFTGGEQVYAPGAGTATGISYDAVFGRRFVVGLMEADTQGRAVSTVDFRYQTPTTTGSLSQQLVPFVSTAGQYHFEGSYQGVYPVLNVAGVALDV